MKYIFTLLAALATLASCTTLNQADIQRLEPTAFEPLTLRPNYELYDFRMDIIRQQESQMVDSTMDTSDTPYHRLGFDLGNGLFFDLNENLSFDLLTLMEVDSHGELSVLQSFKKNGLTWKKLVVNSDNWCVEQQRLFKQKRCYDLERADNELKVFRKDRLRYSILNEPDTVQLFNRQGKVRDQLVRIDEHTFLEGTRRRRDEFALKDQLVNLDNYRVALTRSGREIQILRRRKRTDKLLYRIIRDANTIYVFNSLYRGYKVILGDEHLSVFSNRKKLYDIKLESEEVLSMKRGSSRQ